MRSQVSTASQPIPPAAGQTLCRLFQTDLKPLATCRSNVVVSDKAFALIKCDRPFQDSVPFRNDTASESVTIEQRDAVEGVASPFSVRNSVRQAEREKREILAAP